MSKPSKQEFADLMNRFLGQEIMSEQKLAYILKEGKMAVEKQGLHGLFSFMRMITGASVSDEKMNEILQGLLQGEPNRVWDRLNAQAKLANRDTGIANKKIRSRYPRGK